MRLKELLSLKYNPVGIKLHFDESEINKDLTPSKPMAICEAIRVVAMGEWKIQLSENYISCKGAKAALGFIEPQAIKDMIKTYGKDDEVVEKILKNRPKIENIKAITFFPFVKNSSFDILAIIVDAYQILLLNQAFVFQTGENLTFTMGSNSTLCSYGLAYVFREKIPNLVVPCAGAKIKACFEDKDALYFIPYEKFENLEEALSLVLERQKEKDKFPYIPSSLGDSIKRS